MKKLDPGYDIQVDKVNKQTWEHIVSRFDDANFYHTWSYAKIAWGEENLSHIILTKNGKTVSAAQVRIARFPLLPAGFAYLTWGPLWRERTEGVNLVHLANMIKALINEYVIRRGYLLRAFPKFIADEENRVRDMFREEGFAFAPDVLTPVIIDLSPSIEDLRKNLGNGWKNTLKKAEKIKWTFLEGTGEELNPIAVRLIREMKARKKFVEFGDMEDLIAIQRDLPENLKMHMAFTVSDGEPVSVLSWTTFGKTAHMLVAAIGDKGLKHDASYPLYWKMICDVKNKGCTHLDMGGASNERNPGGYYFKTGLAGKQWTKRGYIGQFEACESYVSSTCFKTALSLRDRYRQSLYKLKAQFPV